MINISSVKNKKIIFFLPKTCKEKKKITKKYIYYKGIKIRIKKNDNK
jgi:hypothetical protein